MRRVLINSSLAAVASVISNPIRVRLPEAQLARLAASLVALIGAGSESYHQRV